MPPSVRERIKCVLCERPMYPESLPNHMKELHSKVIANRKSQIELNSLRENEDASFEFDEPANKQSEKSTNQTEGNSRDKKETETARSRATKFARTNRLG